MPGISKDRWRHQEDSSDENPQAGGTEYERHNKNAAPSEAQDRSTNDAQTATSYGDASRFIGDKDEVEVMCGPLLNYKRMSHAGEVVTWHGSVLIVTIPGHRQPVMRLRQSYERAEGSQRQEGGNYTNGDTPTNGHSADRAHTFDGVRLFEDPAKAFWRFEVDLAMHDQEIHWEYTIDNFQYASSSLAKQRTRWAFVVPACSQSMRIMFHSCNGFSTGTDESAWSGTPLWADVLRLHEQRPFHVMIGGGDQIYNDGVRIGKGPLKQWTNIANPKKRRDYPFNEDLRARCDQYYCDNYIRWFSTEPFASANGQIPQVNIWDDHDIIDGFGSYTDHFMRCAVFRGIGGVSFKYYCLFQHHIPPPVSTFTTDSPQTFHSQGPNGVGADPIQLKDTFVLMEKPDPSFITGRTPGPYVEERSKSLYMQLGARIALVGIDARTERTRHQINYPETYDLIFSRVSAELTTNKSIAHLILLLGIPIAYPRLQWLENFFTSPLIAPIRFLNKRFGLAGGFFNHFDGQVDLLDDLDDHYTSRSHKKERRNLMYRLQSLAQTHGVRITILGGDVHLAATGRFYANPKLGVPTTEDPRYMANIISSAITNKPPPRMVADLLARRNKIHHLDHDTDETLMPLFNKNPGDSDQRAAWNAVTMPSRNFAIITEHARDGSGRRPSEPRVPGHTDTSGSTDGLASAVAPDGHHPLHAGEKGAGTGYACADGVSPGPVPGGLDVCIRVEIDQHDARGLTEGYGFSIPELVMRSVKVEEPV